MSLTLTSEALEKYQNASSFQDLVSLNKEFIDGAINSPYTDGLQPETTPLKENLLQLNSLGLLTTNSGSGAGCSKKPKRAYLIGLVEGQAQAEKLEVLLNQSDIIAYKLPCNVPGYKPEEEEKGDGVSVDLLKIPVTFKEDSQVGELVVDRYVTCYNWITLLQPCVQSSIYETLAKHCYNFYIIDPISNRSALADDGILNKVKQALEKLKK